MDATPLENLPTLIRALKRLGTSHRSIAAAVGVSDMSISRWADGATRPDPARLIELAACAADALTEHGHATTREAVLKFLRGGADPPLRALLDQQLEVANPLRALRLKLGRSVVDAATAMKITRQYLHELEALPADAPRLVRFLRTAQRVLRAAPATATPARA